MIKKRAVMGLVVGLSAFATVYAAPPAAPGNLFTNGDMENDADADGVPDGWECHSGVRLGTGDGRCGGRTLTIQGPGMPPGRWPLYAFAGKAFELKKGRAYRLSWWWKCEDLPGRAATVGVAVPATAMDRLAQIPRDWEQQAYTFVAEKNWPRDSPARDSFYIGLSFPGTVYVDDVRLDEIPVDEARPPEEDFVVGTRPAWPEKKGGNLVPNASFEVGSSGWGSWAPRCDGTWPKNEPCRLLSKLDETVAYHGRQSLRIELDGDDLPTQLHATRGGAQPYTSLFAGTYGALPVQKGKKYVLSAWLKADRPDTVGVLEVYDFPPGNHALPEKRFAVSTQWRRCTLVFSPEEDFVIPLVGLAWQPTGRKRATLWVDAVQLEQLDENAGAAEEPGAFQTRQPMEAAIDTDKIGNVFEKGQSLQATMRIFNNGPAKESFAGEVVVTDYWDREIARFPASCSVGPREGRTMYRDTKIERAGFYRVRLLVEGQPQPSLMQNLRAAIIKPYRREEHPGLPRAGINYPPPWPALRDLMGKAGMGIVRYWDFWWDFIEPAEGRPDYRFQERDVESLARDGFDAQAMWPQPAPGWLTNIGYEGRHLYRPRHWSAYWHAEPNRHWERPRYNFPFRLIERPGGGKAVELVATGASPRLHQQDTLRLSKGKRYRVSFDASRRGGADGKAHVALLTYPERVDAGLDQVFEPLGEERNVPRWQRHKFDFTCTADTLLGSSLQFCLDTPGILAIDDVSLREVTAEGELGPELVLNGDFEDVFPDVLRHYMIAIASGTKEGKFPRDLTKVRELCARTVRQFKDRVKHWEVLNEPTFMSEADYARYLEQAYLGIKDADPDAVVVGGLDTTTMTFVGGIGCLWNLGAQAHLDVVTVHTYEGTLAPEAIEKHLEDVNACMDAHGGRKPIRVTEGGYWADDTPARPRWKYPAYLTLVENEQVRGDYLARFETILFGNGVDCIMYFPGESPSLTDAWVGPWCLEYGCEPRKVYPVRAAFSHVVTPEAKIEKKLHFFEDSIYAYVFSRKDDAIAVVWSPKKTYRIDRKLFKDAAVLDIFGEPLNEESVSISGSAIYLAGDSVDAILEAAAGLSQAGEQCP